MDNSNHFAVERYFNSFTEVQKIGQFEETFQMIHMKDSKTAEITARHTGKTYNADLKNDFIQFKCYYGGKIFKSQNIRKHEKTAKIDCPFTIYLRSTKDGQQLQVKSVSGDTTSQVIEME